MIDNRGDAHRICPTCAKRVHGRFNLARHATGVVTPVAAGDATLIEPIGLWQIADRLSLTASAEPTESTPGIQWHVQVNNLSRGQTRILCMLPSDCVAFVPDETGSSSVSGWVRFSRGEWTHDIPSKPGLYPIRGGQTPSHMHTIRAVLKHDGIILLGEDDGEMTQAIFGRTVWIWSVPMPQLPRLPG